MAKKRVDGWWIEPLIKWGFAIVGIGGMLLSIYVYAHFIRKFW